MFAALGIANALQMGTDDGLTFREVLADLPSDPASIFAIVFALASVALVLWAGRPRGKGGRPA